MTTQRIGSASTAHLRLEARRIEPQFLRPALGDVLPVFNPEATLRGDRRTAPPDRGHSAPGIKADDLSGWRERLAAQGVGVEKEVRWPRGGQSPHLRDPAGNSVEPITPGLWGLPSGWWEEEG